MNMFPHSTHNSGGATPDQNTLTYGDMDDIDCGITRSRCNTWPIRKPENDEIPTVELQDDNLSPIGGFGVGPEWRQPGSGMEHLSELPPGLATKKRTKNAWGNISYADLITQAILNCPEKRLTLSQIYDWIVQNVPYFKERADTKSSAGWKNSIRHNLSLHDRFVRIPNDDHGKSSWWMLNPQLAQAANQYSTALGMARRPSMTCIPNMPHMTGYINLAMSPGSDDSPPDPGPMRPRAESESQKYKMHLYGLNSRGRLVRSPYGTGGLMPSSSGTSDYFSSDNNYEPLMEFRPRTSSGLSHLSSDTEVDDPRIPTLHPMHTLPTTCASFGVGNLTGADALNTIAEKFEGIDCSSSGTTSNHRPNNLLQVKVEQLMNAPFTAPFTFGTSRPTLTSPYNPSMPYVGPRMGSSVSHTDHLPIPSNPGSNASSGTSPCSNISITPGGGVSYPVTSSHHDSSNVQSIGCHAITLAPFIAGSGASKDPEMFPLVDPNDNFGDIKTAGMEHDDLEEIQVTNFSWSSTASTNGTALAHAVNQLPLHMCSPAVSMQHTMHNEDFVSQVGAPI